MKLGYSLGIADGSFEGVYVGFTLGPLGIELGLQLGSFDGIVVGSEVNVGLALFVGLIVGL